MRRLLQRNPSPTSTHWAAERRPFFCVSDGSLGSRRIFFFGVGAPKEKIWLDSVRPMGRANSTAQRPYGTTARPHGIFLRKFHGETPELFLVKLE